MKRSLAVLLFVVASTFLCGNALALDTYIPHITTGANDWTDYLQANNNASSTATFTLTLYGSTGAQVYSQSHSVGGRSRSQIQLKALNSSAASGKITYTEPGLVFRVSYESLSGGVAEFKTIDTLGSNIGFYFSDFSSLVQWKGMAITNMGTTNADITFYALGGGTILQTHTETIAPKAKLVGNNFNLSWLSGLQLSQIESIIAVAGSSSLCGIAIAGDTALSRLLFTPAIPVSNFITPGSTYDSLIGNYKLVYTISTTWTDRITLNTKKTDKTPDDTYFFQGYDANYPSVTIAVGAWFPSISSVVIGCSVIGYSSITQFYYFTIDSDDTLSGYTKLSSTSSNHYAFIKPDSHKFPLGSWGTSMTSIMSQNDPIDINEVFAKKMAEDQAGQMQRTKFVSPVHEALLTSKINELKAKLRNLR